MIVYDTVSPVDDEYFTANLDATFYFSGKTSSGRGKLKGTTYSGHCTATTLMGTLRNFLYHLFSFYRH